MRTLYWNRKPGQFVNKNTGQGIDLSKFCGVGPAFTGSVREWYETLVETIYDATSNVRTPDTKIYVGADVSTMLMASVLFNPDCDKAVDEQGTIGTISGMKIIRDDRQRNEIKIVNGNIQARVIVEGMNVI